MHEPIETPPPKTRSHHKARTRPVCGSKKVAPIMYGYPSDMDGAPKAAREGHIWIGGCVTSPDSPKWRCLACHHGWGRLGS